MGATCFLSAPSPACCCQSPWSCWMWKVPRQPSIRVLMGTAVSQVTLARPGASPFWRSSKVIWIWSDMGTLFCVPLLERTRGPCQPQPCSCSVIPGSLRKDNFRGEMAKFFMALLSRSSFNYMKICFWHHLLFAIQTLVNDTEKASFPA